MASDDNLRYDSDKFKHPPLAELVDLHREHAKHLHGAATRLALAREAMREAERAYRAAMATLDA